MGPILPPAILPQPQTRTKLGRLCGAGPAVGCRVYGGVVLGSITTGNLSLECGNEL